MQLEGVLLLVGCCHQALPRLQQHRFLEVIRYLGELLPTQFVSRAVGTFQRPNRVEKPGRNARLTPVALDVGRGTRRAL